MTRLLPLLLACSVLLGACGGDDGGGGGDATPAPPPSVQAAQEVRPEDFPAAGGKSLQELADGVGSPGPQAALASTVFTPGENRVAFGVIDQESAFVYGPTVVYVARGGAGGKAEGPYPAPADSLLTAPPFRSKTAATEEDPFAAVYEAFVPLERPGRHALLTVTKVGEELVTAGTELRVVRAAKDPVPAVGEPAPRVETDTLESVGGDVELLDTRLPPSDMHEASFADVVGKKPVALLFATPQLCQSRVCGPVVDIAAQMKERYGDRVEFIHQEVYSDNDPNKGLREPLERFGLPTEPWLFTVDATGRIAARLEGSFGLRAFERAVEAALRS